MQCNGQPVLPVGVKDEIGVDTVKIFCPKCKSVYQPPPIRTRSSGHHSSNSGGGGAVDGAAFGTTFPHLFLMTFNNLVPDPLPSDSAYIPRVFGFRVHKSAGSRNATSGSTRLSSSALSRTNGRRVGASAGFTSQRVINTASASANPGVDASLGKEEPKEPAAVKDATQDVKAGKSTSTAAADGGNAPAEQAGDNSKSSNASAPKPATKKAGDANGDGAGDSNTAREKAGANDGGDTNTPKRKVKSEGSNSVASNDNEAGKNRSSKRQKRQAVGTEAT